VRTLLRWPNYPWGGGLGHHPVRTLAGAPLGPELLLYMGYRLFSGFGWGFTVNQHFLRSRMGTVMPMYACCGFCATFFFFFCIMIYNAERGGRPRAEGTSMSSYSTTIYTHTNTILSQA
jgi:hypothetical protein